MNFLSNAWTEMQSTWSTLLSTHGAGHLSLLLLALAVACGFECVNGFHDAANAVATVIYTNTLKPWVAIVWSGLCNFAGVILGGTAVAMGIIKLLPQNLLVTPSFSVSMAMIFALLLAAIAWNLGTWYLGIPASSSHTLIGAILGIGLANAYVTGRSISEGVNWTKATEVGLALLISPLLGFLLSALLLRVSHFFVKSAVFHQTPPEGKAPPWMVRSTLFLTSSGVSFAHGSNDGQKGIGLIMLILIVLGQGQFALRSDSRSGDLQNALVASQQMELTLARAPVRGYADSSFNIIHTAFAAAVEPIAQAKPVSTERDTTQVSADLQAIQSRLTGKASLASIQADDRVELRKLILRVDQGIGKLESSGSSITHGADWKQIQAERGQLKYLTDYAPTWVILMIALSIGFGTMIGWKRVVVTLGEKIGKHKLTYAQGAAAQFVAMSTIGVSAFAGLPVSTTHVLSSGIAGTMVAQRAGLQSKTVGSIALAWLLTLPVSMLLSAGLFLMFLKVIP